MREIETFFDNLAPTWDEGESCPTERKLDLLKEAGIEKGDIVLDVACGTGVVTGLIHSLSESKVIGIDISSNMIELAKKKYEKDDWASFIRQDLLEYEGDALFDDIIIYNAYPHFMEPSKLASKCHSLLKEGGRLAILHSLSRKALDAHHSGKAKPISRFLDEVKEEVKFFDAFKVITAKEDDSSIVIVLEK